MAASGFNFSLVDINCVCIYFFYTIHTLNYYSTYYILFYNLLLHCLFDNRTNKMNLISMFVMRVESFFVPKTMLSKNIDGDIHVFILLDILFAVCLSPPSFLFSAHFTPS